MLSPDEVIATKRSNTRSIRELIWFAYACGMNLMKPRRTLDYAMRFLNVMLVLCSVLSLYAHWATVMYYMPKIPLIVEPICTTFQTLMSVTKLVYYLFVQRKFYLLVKQARTHELLQKCEIFHKDFPTHAQLKIVVTDIMNECWRSTRRQLLFYVFCCVSIVLNYNINSHLVNIYHYIQQTPDYKPILPFPVFYPRWQNKGMQFPYYAIEMFLGTCAVHISGIGAVSFDCLFIVLCLHSVALMKSLCALVKGATSAQIPKQRRVEYLRYCIYQYQRIISYSEDVRTMFRHLSLIQFILSLLVWGLVLFNLGIGIESNKTVFVRMVMYLAAAGYQIVIYCYNGQQLTLASEEIPNAFYSCEWYTECAEFKQLIRMMIMRTNRCFFLDVSWFTTMSLPTLMIMVKTSGSYFLLLRNVNE